MSYFYGNVQGNRGETTRGGSKNSGIEGHIRGWKSGARVVCTVNDVGEDIVEVYATRGSGYNEEGKFTGLVMRTVDGKLDFLVEKKQ